jgi:hypothetical protein
MFLLRARRGRLGSARVAGLVTLLLAGCNGVGTRHPVEGQVLIDGKPMRGITGSVRFVPDGAKGNAGQFTATGEIDTEGRYKLVTRGKPGAPAGWYRVVVTALPPGAGDREVVRRPAVHGRYGAEASTPLSVEVVPRPEAGAYDLKVTRN